MWTKFPHQSIYFINSGCEENNAFLAVSVYYVGITTLKSFCARHYARLALVYHQV